MDQISKGFVLSNAQPFAISLHTSITQSEIMTYQRNWR